jgi:hypothetical protein
MGERDEILTTLYRETRCLLSSREMFQREKKLRGEKMSFLKPKLPSEFKVTISG